MTGNIWFQSGQNVLQQKLFIMGSAELQSKLSFAKHMYTISSLIDEVNNIFHYKWSVIGKRLSAFKSTPKKQQ